MRITHYELKDLLRDMGHTTPGGRPHSPDRRRADRRLIVRVMASLLLGECSCATAARCLPCRVAGALGPLLRSEVARALKEAANARL